MLYTEQTPNPESLKFVTNRMNFKGTADFKTEELAKEWSALASVLFEKPFVKGVYICKNLDECNIAINEIFDGRFGKAELVLIEEFYCKSGFDG